MVIRISKLKWRTVGIEIKAQMVFVPLAKATWLFLALKKIPPTPMTLGLNMGLIFVKDKHLLGLQQGYCFGTHVKQ